MKLREGVDVYARAPLLGKELTREQAIAVRVSTDWEDRMFTEPRGKPALSALRSTVTGVGGEAERIARVWACYTESYIEHHQKVGFTQWDVEVQQQEFESRKVEIISSIKRENAKGRWDNERHGEEK